MIKKSDLLDPTSTEKLSEKEKKIVADAQRAGKSLRSSDPSAGNKNVTAPHDTGGVIEQNVDSKAIAAFGRPGDESDISGDAANPGRRTNVGGGN
jgi:hypothetical protein